MFLVGHDRKLPFQPDKRQVRLLFVLTQVRAHQLKQMIGPLMALGHEMRLDPMVYSAEDLQRSLDVFPLQIIDIKRGYEVLYGPDVLKGVKLHRPDMRLAVERELKTVISRLHHLFLVRSGLRPAWQEAIQDTVPQIVRLIGFCLLLAGQRVPNSLPEQLQGAEQWLGLDAEALLQAHDLKSLKIRPDAAEMSLLFDRYLDNLGRLAHWIDQFKVNS